MLGLHMFQRTFPEGVYVLLRGSQRLLTVLTFRCCSLPYLFGVCPWPVDEVFTVGILSACVYSPPLHIVKYSWATEEACPGLPLVMSVRNTTLSAEGSVGLKAMVEDLYFRSRSCVVHLVEMSCFWSRQEDYHSHHP